MRRLAFAFAAVLLLGAAAGPALAQAETDPVTVEGPPASAVVLIFNHGTNRPQYVHACNRQRDLPGIVADIAAARRWTVHYLCSGATDGREPGSYTYKRADEILAAAARFRAIGVPARNIFLFGHSAGGWSSLMAARKSPALFNAVIAFAPAFAGPRYEQAKYPWWRGDYLPRQIAYLRQAPRLDALIFAYDDDDFERPADLAPLATIPGLHIVPFNACASGHRTAYSDCFRARARNDIDQYIRERLGDGTRR